MKKQKPEPDDATLNRQALHEERLLREALSGGEDKKKPPPGKHWYKDRQSREAYLKKKG